MNFFAKQRKFPGLLGPFCGQGDVEVDARAARPSDGSGPSAALQRRRKPDDLRVLRSKAAGRDLYGSICCWAAARLGEVLRAEAEVLRAEAEVEVPEPGPW